MSKFIIIRILYTLLFGTKELFLVSRRTESFLKFSVHKQLNVKLNSFDKKW